MESVARKVTLLLVVVPVAGSIGCMSSFQSSFLTKFSLKDLVQRNESVGGLNCSAGGGGDGISIGTGGVGTVGKESNFHRAESLGCQIADVAQFDEAKLIQALKQSIEKDLGASKAEIIKSEDRAPNNFLVQYTVTNLSGRIEISGTRSGNFYSLKADLDEKNSAQ